MKKILWFAAFLTGLLLLVLTDSFCQIGQNFEVQILGQSEYLAGSKASLRIITFDPVKSSPITGIPIRLSLKTPDHKPILLNQGVSDESGSWEGCFKLPDDVVGNCEFIINARDQEIKAPTKLIKVSRIYLTTDKPLYQPGQTIHLRILALTLPKLTPRALDSLTIEIEDGKGNKVFKQKAKTSKFGIASADFELADEVNMGNYRARAYFADSSQEKTFTVKKYVLPKFKVGLKTRKNYYLPGETVRGEISANYFFGKPVAKGQVTLVASGYQGEMKTFTRIMGDTDKNGNFSFSFKIPDYLVGLPLDKGKGMINLEIKVQDTASHTEKLLTPLSVAAQPILVELYPECGNLKPGLINKVYLSTSYPDQSPAQTLVKVQSSGKNYEIKTDQTGWGVLWIKPEAGITQNLNLTVSDSRGNRVSQALNLNADSGADNLILRTFEARAKTGDILKMEILSTRRRGNIYLDVIANRQTILTKALDLKNGKIDYELALTPDMIGLVTINAYQIMSGRDIIRDSKNLFVSPNNDLKIAIQPGKGTFLPGEDGKINFVITDRNGNPVPAALGVDIVDEAVFALGEREAGFEKIYFLLEKELLEPKYEIHGVGFSQSLLQKKPGKWDKVLLQKAPQPQFGININTYQQKLVASASKMQRIQGAMYNFYSKHNRYPKTNELNLMVREKFLTQDEITDPWGRKFYLKKTGSGNSQPEVACLGADGRNGGKDDFTLNQVYSLMPPQEGRMLGGEIKFKGMLEDRAMPMAQNEMMKAEKPSMSMVGSSLSELTGGKKENAAPRVREYFPETLYTNPQILTDDYGKTSITLKMADSITTWRISGFANSMQGEMGSNTCPLRVFQDFFVDLDLPVALTQNDEISIPAAVYNYLPRDQKVKLVLEKNSWFELMDEPVKTVSLKKNEVKAVFFRIKVKKLGWQKLTLMGYGEGLSDAIRREIEILPDGEEVVSATSDRLDGDLTKTIEIPKNAISDASRISVAIYPGVLSQVVEGLDKILRMPCGCFEQTSASTYPNALVWDYLKKQKKLTPELQMKVEGYINTGYQRLVSFEVQGGGFSWFGEPPANKILTAFGVMEFNDINKVYEIDERVIRRTSDWLYSQQQADGSWKPDESYLHQESWSRIQNNNLPVTAYITWAMLEGGSKDSRLDRAVNYLKKNWQKADDPYTLSLVANALAEFEPKGELTLKILRKLSDQAKTDKDSARWESKMATATFSEGPSANLETTALAAYALLKASVNPQLAGKALTYIVKAKDPQGTWYSTQGTILAMKVLLLAQEKATEEVSADITVSVNGKGNKSIHLTPENFDVYYQLDFKPYTVNGRNQVKINFSGKGSCFYQVRTKYFLPWNKEAKEPSPITINLKYDHSSLKQNDIMGALATVQNHTSSELQMVMVDLGVPAGFSVMASELDQLVKAGKIQKYTLTSRQIIIYLEKLAPNQTLNISYQLLARYPIKVKTPISRIYKYYNPEVEDTVKPVTLEVK